MANYSPQEQQLWMMLLEQQRRKRAFNGAVEGREGEREEEREDNSGPQQLGQGVVPGAEQTIADMPSYSMQDQGIVSGAEQTITDIPSHSMPNVQMQLKLPEQRDEKRVVNMEAQQEKGERETEEEREDVKEKERESQDISTSHQQDQDVEQQHRGPPEPNTNLSDPVSAPLDMSPQTSPHYHSRPTGSNKEASRRVLGGRVESHMRPQRTPGTERERHEEMAARLAELERVHSLHPADVN